MRRTQEKLCYIYQPYGPLVVQKKKSSIPCVEHRQFNGRLEIYLHLDRKSFTRFFLDQSTTWSVVASFCEWLISLFPLHIVCKGKENDRSEASHFSKRKRKNILVYCFKWSHSITRSFYEFVTRSVDSEVATEDKWH